MTRQPNSGLVNSTMSAIRKGRRKLRAYVTRSGGVGHDAAPVMSVAPVALLGLLAMGVAPMPLQGACSVPGANSALTKLGALIISGIGIAGVVKFGGGFIVGLFTGAGGKLKVLRLVAVGTVAVIVALNFQSLIEYAVGGGLDQIGLGCMFSG